MVGLKQTFLVIKCQKKTYTNTCIAYITIDSVMKIRKKNYPKVYLEEYKYKIEKIKMSKFMEAELKSESESVLESELESDSELKAKLEYDSDSE